MSDVNIVRLDAVAQDRRSLAKWVMFVAFGLLVLVSIAIIGAVAIMFRALTSPDMNALDQAVGHFQALLATVLPLIGAWVGAIIAFYFARENFDAATQSTQVLIRELRPNKLERIPASDAMVPREKMVTATLPTDGTKLVSDIITMFKGHGRLPVLENDLGKGVLHDGTVRGFVDKWEKDPAKVGTAPTLNDLLSDQEVGKLFTSSVAYVSATASLAVVKEEMEKQSKISPKSCRDAFVTATGTNAGKVVGYITELDLMKFGAYG